MEKVKVLMVLGNTRMGGTQAFILNVLRNIDLSKFQIDIAINFSAENGGIDDELKSYGCEIFYWPYFKVFNYVKFVRFWRKFLKEHPYDIIHAHSTNSAPLYLKIAKEAGCVTIAHSHSAGYRGSALEQFVKKLFVKRIGDVSDYWFACSDKAALRLYGDGYRNYPRYFDIPNAINAENYMYNVDISKRIRRQLGVPEDALLCGHVGTFSTPKNHKFLIDVFHEVIKKHPNSWLVCCGAGALMESVKEKAKNLGLQEKVLFPGVVKNCNEYMMAMDAFVFPSIFEGFPISVIEAEATGVNVVMSDVITDEVDLTPCVHRLSLDDEPSKWAEVIVNLKVRDRSACNVLIATSKYNMQTSISLISGLYEEMTVNRNNKR